MPLCRDCGTYFFEGDDLDQEESCECGKMIEDLFSPMIDEDDFVYDNSEEDF